MEKDDAATRQDGEMAAAAPEGEIAPETPETFEAPEASATSEAAAAPDLVVITGMSGAGRTEAMHTFEDIGYFCIDNLPPGLLGNLVSLAGIASEHPRKLAVVCDLRSAGLSGELADELSRLGDYGLSYCVVFLDSTDTALLNRYKANRRRHPLAGPGVSIADGIARERALMREVKHAADYVIDTSAKRPQQTREEIRRLFGSEQLGGGLNVTVYSFGFKHGPALDADIVIDVRFLPNPFYEPALRDKTGLDAEVRDYVMDNPETKRFCAHWNALLDVVMPGYVAEGKQYLSIAVGCTGGQHRSVAIAAATGRHLAQAGYQVVTSHRDISLAQGVAR